MNQIVDNSNSDNYETESWLNEDLDSDDDIGFWLKADSIKT